MKTIVKAVTLFVIGLSMIGVASINNIRMTQDCIGHLKLAADASSIQLAKQEIDIAIEYLESNNITSGYTSIIYKTPSDDVGYWYANLKAAQNELEQVTDSTSAMERTNILMKLRETLIDNEKSGYNITAPNGISRYPHNTLWAIFISIAVALICIGTLLFSTSDI